MYVSGLPSLSTVYLRSVKMLACGQCVCVLMGMKNRVSYHVDG